MGKIQEFVIVLVILSIGLFWGIAKADPMVPVINGEVDTLSADSGNESGYMPAPYCGIYSLYLAAKALNHEITFSQLVKPQYISSKLGSSLADLVLACEDVGLRYRMYSSLTCVDLKQSISPAILHVALEPGANRYTHWVLYLGNISGKAKIMSVRNGEVQIELWDYAELASRWDGICLMLDTEQSRLISFHLAFLVNRLFYASVIFLAVAGCFLLKHSQKHFSSTISPKLFLLKLCKQTSIIILFALGACILYSLYMGYIFLGYSPAIARIQDNHIDNFVPKISAEKAALWGEQPDVIFIDARPKEDYKKGHLDRAINIEPNSDINLAGEIQTNARVVVYCQSSGCAYGNDVLNALQRSGYTNLYYFRGGWVEWEQYQQSKQ